LKEFHLNLILSLQYKDAFFTANPTFKWYKLPAPPLRTLSTRPTNDRSIISPSYVGGPQFVKGNRTTDGDDLEETEMPVFKSARKISKKSSVGEFKLADEAEMGGLSSLINMNSGSSFKPIEEDTGNLKKIFEEIKLLFIGSN
jgi:hypothetical protein